MTTDSTLYPGRYELLKVEISPLIGSNRRPQDILNLVPSLSISESINNDSIRGKLRVLDSAGFLENYPLRGEERIFIQIKDTLGNIQDIDAFLYKIDNVSATSMNDTLTYDVYFVSKQRFMADINKIIKAYRDKTASEIVQEIFDEYYKPTQFGDEVKDLELENTEGPLRCIIPNYTPLQAIKFLESRSYSSSSPSCSFRFFESKQGFHFISDEYIFRKAEENNRIFEMSSFHDIPNTGDLVMSHMANLSRVQNVKRFDTFEDMQSGAYRNKVVVMDINNRQVNLKTDDYSYDYLQERNKFFDLQAEETLSERHTDDFSRFAFTEENGRRFLFMKDYDTEHDGQLRGEQYIPEITNNRVSYRSHLNGIKVATTGPGRCDITCGDVVDLKVQEYSFPGGDPNALNKQLSGKYIVESINKIFDKETSHNEYILMKRNWSEIVSSGIVTGVQ